MMRSRSAERFLPTEGMPGQANQALIRRITPWPRGVENEADVPGCCISHDANLSRCSKMARDTEISDWVYNAGFVLCLLRRREISST
jgi:hypothetical protein